MCPHGPCTPQRCIAVLDGRAATGRWPKLPVRTRDRRRGGRCSAWFDAARSGRRMAVRRPSPAIRTTAPTRRRARDEVGSDGHRVERPSETVSTRSRVRSRRDLGERTLPPAKDVAAPNTLTSGGGARGGRRASDGAATAMLRLPAEVPLLAKAEHAGDGSRHPEDALASRSCGSEAHRQRAGEPDPGRGLGGRGPRPFPLPVRAAAGQGIGRRRRSGGGGREPASPCAGQRGERFWRSRRGTSWRRTAASRAASGPRR